MADFATDLETRATALIPTVASTGAARLDGPELLQLFGIVVQGLRALQLNGDGSQMLILPRAPLNSEGSDGDGFLNSANGDLYAKAGGAWDLRGSLRGPEGPVSTRPGPPGPASTVPGPAGKSAYQLWQDSGNVGTVLQFLASLKAKDGNDGKDGQRGSRITASEVAPGAAVQVGGDVADSNVPLAGDTHFQLLATGQVRIWVFGAGGWAPIYTSPLGAAVQDGAITNDKLATDVKVGSLGGARNAYPAADRAGLTTVETFLVWIGGKMSDVLSRVGSLETGFGTLSTLVNGFGGRISALEARPVGGTSTGGTGSTNGVTLTAAGDGTKYLANDGTYKTITSSGPGVTLEQNLSTNSTTAAPSVAAVKAALDISVLLSRQPFAVTQTTGRLPMGFYKGSTPVFSGLFYDYDTATAAFRLQYYDVNGDTTETGPYAQFAGGSGLNAAIAALPQGTKDAGFVVYGIFTLKAGRSSSVGYYDVNGY